MQQQMMLETQNEKGAEFSPCGKYRYTLMRRWGGVKSRLLPWVMLNPSTADADQDDATIRKCLGFATRSGFQGITVVNLFAYRATDPKDLYAAHERGVDVVGSDNMRIIAELIEQCREDDMPIIAAWGAHGGFLERDRKVIRLLRTARFAKTLCLGRTNEGFPRHPLMIGYGRDFERFDCA